MAHLCVEIVLFNNYLNNLLKVIIHLPFDLVFRHLKNFIISLIEDGRKNFF